MPDALKDNVPDDIKEKAREMARQELQRRLEELDMSSAEARGYGELLAATQAHMLSLHDLLERGLSPPFRFTKDFAQLTVGLRSRGQGRGASVGEATDGWRAR